MLDILFVAITPLFFIWIIKNILFWIHLWQIKEYRLDRTKIHLLETEQGKNLISSNENKLKIALLLFYIVVVFYNDLIGVYSIFVSIIILSSFTKVINEIIDKKSKIPIFTVKTVAIFFFTLLFVVLFYSFPLLNKFFWLLLIDKIVPFLIAILFGIFSIPSDVYKDIIIYKAIKKRIKFASLFVIGITGSYGKGSTKEFISKILSYKHNLLKSYGTFNTDIGLAKTILNELNERKEIFIAEIGGYKLGEIFRISYIVKPNVGIITAVNDQHASLFGSIDNIMKAKYELIESLPRDGIAMFNANNLNVLKLIKKTRRKKVVYYADYENKNNFKYDVVAFNIRVHRYHLLFDVFIKEKNERISSLKARLLGKHNIENILPGIYLGLYLGMNKKQIKSSLLNILPIKKTMEPYIDNKGTILIDDTYNANPDAVRAALNYVDIYKGKKVFVVQPMIELGKASYKHHYDLGKTAGRVCDYLILTNDNFYSAIEKGLQKVNGKCLLNIMSPKKISYFIKSDLTKNDVVVFEGKEAGLSLSLLDYEKVY